MLKNALRPEIAKRSLIVAILVGTILNLINQGDSMINDRHLDLLKGALTYIVPYCVATYGAVAALSNNSSSAS